MGKSRDPRRDEAFEIWKASGGQVDLVKIAAQLGVSDGTLRGWKSKDKWEAKLSETFQPDERNVSQNTERSNRRGAPKGNKNAVGNRGGAPPGNQNAKGNSGGPGGPYRNKKALKTGEYETIFLDTLNEEEQALFDFMDASPLAVLERTLRTLTIQERKIMTRIKQLESGLTDEERKVKEQLCSRKDTREYKDPKNGQLRNVPILTEGMKVTEIQTVTTSRLDKILKQEELLTKVRDKIIRTASQIGAMQREDEKLELARERLELEKRRLLGYGDEEGDDEDEDDEDDLEW